MTPAPLTPAQVEILAARLRRTADGVAIVPGVAYVAVHFGCLPVWFRPAGPLICDGTKVANVYSSMAAAQAAIGSQA